MEKDVISNNQDDIQGGSHESSSSLAFNGSADSGLKTIEFLSLRHLNLTKEKILKMKKLNKIIISGNDNVFFGRNSFSSLLNLEKLGILNTFRYFIFCILHTKKGQILLLKV